MKKVLIVTSAYLIITGSCFSQSEGPNNPGSATYSVAGCLACPGGEWNDLQNITNNDHQYVDVSLASFPLCFQTTCFYSRILYAFDFGFTIPLNAVITGVSADVMRKSTAGTGVSDSAIQLYTGEPVGINHASTAFWTPNPMYVTYGDSLDTWGYTLSPDSVNNAQFGLAVLVKNYNLTTTFSTASVDHIKMTVYYDAGTGIQSQTKSSEKFVVHYNLSSSTLDIIAKALKINSILITDNLGRQIFNSEQPLVAVQSKLTLPPLQKGIYFAVADIDGKMVTKKFTIE